MRRTGRHHSRTFLRGTPLGVTISGQGIAQRSTGSKATGGLVTFLGDWYTHPGGAARPSVRDDTAVADIAGDADFKTPEPLIGMVATPRLPRRAANIVEFFAGNSAGLLTRLAASAFAQMPALGAPFPSGSPTSP